MKKQRNYAAFWEWPDKEVKEVGIMKDYLAARDAEQLPSYGKVAAFKPDPPDFVAEDKDGRLTAIELTELVSKEAIEANITASKLEEYVYRDWRKKEVVAAIEERLSEKDGKQFHGGPYSEIHLVIHVDELVISASEYGPILEDASFASRQQISRAFVLFSPGDSLVELRLGNRGPLSQAV